MPTEFRAAIKHLSRDRTFVLSVALGVVSIAIAIAAWVKAAADQTHDPVDQLLVEFNTDNVVAGEAAPLHLVFCANRDDVPLFFASFWTATNGEQRLGPGTIAGTEKGCRSLDILVGVPASLPPGSWRLVVHMFAVGADEGTQTIVVATTTPRGRTTPDNDRDDGLVVTAAS